MRVHLLLSFLLLAGLLNGADFGSQSMVAPLTRVMVKRPDKHYCVQDPELWHYTGRPDLTTAQAEHDAFVALLRSEGVEVLYHADEQPGRADSIFVYDPAIVTDKGAIILRMGKQLRRGEEAAMEAALGAAGVPVYYRLSGKARAEGGDTLWIDEKTLALGQGYRTNAEAADQLRQALAEMGVDVITVPLPVWGGEDACLHLMSLISPVDEATAVVYKKLLPVPFLELLEERGYHLLDVSDQEFERMGTNVLAIRPGVVVMLEGNPRIKAELEQRGVRVLTYKGREISLKSEGGPTCLTRPLHRLSKVQA